MAERTPSTGAGSRALRDAAGSAPVRVLGRVGLVAYGVVHLLVAYLAARVALGRGARETDKAGALETVAAQPAGRGLLWLIAAGLAALVVWQLAEAAWGHRGREGGGRAARRLASLGRAAVFGALAVSAGRVALRGDGGSPGDRAALTARVMSWSLGRLAVVVVGVAIVVVAAGLLYVGLTKRFVEELELGRAGPALRAATVRLGQVGFAALAVAYGVAGALVVVAAARFDPGKATGLDAALKTLAAQPFGVVLLLAVAAGLASFAAYCFAHAWLRR